METIVCLCFFFESHTQNHIRSALCAYGRTSWGKNHKDNLSKIFDSKWKKTQNTTNPSLGGANISCQKLVKEQKLAK